MIDLRKVVVVTGPTATGKTALAIRLARKWNGEVISIDSRQVYRGMDLGTGKDLLEYREGGEPVPFHLIDIVDPGEEYNLAFFMRDAFAAITDVSERGKLPILCGGSTMYLDALLKGYRLPGAALPRDLDQPRERQNRESNLSFTPPFKLDALVLGVYYPRETVRRRIEERLDIRLKSGMIDEVAALHADGVSYERLEFFGLEYREIARFLQGLCDQQTMRTELLNRIRQFAKRQDIFFRKMERENIVIHWLPEGNAQNADELVCDFLNNKPLPEPQLKISDIYYGRKTS